MLEECSISLKKQIRLVPIWYGAFFVIATRKMDIVLARMDI